MEYTLSEYAKLLKNIGLYLSVNIVVARIILAVSVLLTGFLLRQLFVKVIMRILLKLTKKTATQFDEMLVSAFEKPARALLAGFIVWLSINVALNFPKSIILYTGLKIYVLIVVFWFLYRATDSVIYFIEHFLNRTDKRINPSVIGLLSKSLKVLIVIFEIFSIIDLLGYDVSGIVAGLGLGGLAISLAAKDAAANLIGSITIMLDKTYTIGDWIETSSVQGVVEEIGFRSTRIRTFTDSLVSVPNSIMSNEPVTNWSKMDKRRVLYKLYIPLNTPADNVKILLSKIKDLLKNSEDVNQNATLAVNMEGFDNDSLRIIVHFFTKTTSYATYLHVTEKLNLDILKIFEDMNIPLTVPAQRLVIGDTNSKENLNT